MNPDIVLSALRLPLQVNVPSDPFSVLGLYQNKTLEIDATALDTLMNDVHRQAGTTAYTSEEYFTSEHGKANSHVGLYELVHEPLLIAQLVRRMLKPPATARRPQSRGPDAFHCRADNNQKPCRARR